MTIRELCEAFNAWAFTYYRRRDGSATGETYTHTLAQRPLVELFGDLPAGEFSPGKLLQVRERMIAMDWSRGNINRNVSRIKTMYRWSTEREHVPPSVHHGLLCVRGLPAFRGGARETPKVKPVPRHLVRPIRRIVGLHVRIIIDLMLLTGARCGEIIQLRLCDIDMSRPVWKFRPVQHKTSHHGKERVIFLGPRAQRILKPLLNRVDDAWVFDSREAFAAIRNRRALDCVQGHYNEPSVRNAIQRACRKAFPPPHHLRRRFVKARGRKRKSSRAETDAEWHARIGPAGVVAVREWERSHRWHPHQLRHVAATTLRKRYDLDTVRVILGHSSLCMSDHYAQIDQRRGDRAMLVVG